MWSERSLLDAVATRAARLLDPAQAAWRRLNEAALRDALVDLEAWRATGVGLSAQRCDALRAELAHVRLERDGLLRELEKLANATRAWTAKARRARR